MKNEISQDPPASDHPEPETLLAYHCEQLPADEVETVREHLVACRSCAMLVLEMEGVAARSAEGKLTELDIEHAWRRVRGRLRQEEPRRWLSRHWLLPLAALALVALAAPLLLRQADGIEPVTLRPISPKRGTAAPQRCTVLPEAESWQLRLTVRNDYSALIGYELEILAANGHRLARYEPSHDLTVEVPRAGLPPGRYTFQLVGLGRDEPTLVERYCVDIPER